MLSLFGPIFSHAESNSVKPAWGKPVDGIRAGLITDKTKFESGDEHYIPFVLHIRNDSLKKVTLQHGGSSHGWRWEFHLVNGGAPFVARRDDDTGGVSAPPRTIALEAGASQQIHCQFRQRSFNKWGSGYCSLVPGKYIVSAMLTEWKPGTTPREIVRKIATGKVAIEIRPRHNGWDKVATGEATTLVGLLRDQDRFLRQAAAVFLTEKGKKASPALIRELQDGNSWTRAACAKILGQLREKAQPDVVMAVAKALRDKDPHVRVEAAKSLSLMREAARPAIPALLSVVKNRPSMMLPNVQPAAASALGYIGDAQSEVIAALTGLLKDDFVRKDSHAFTSVVSALGRLGPEAKEAVPVLLEQLQDNSHLNRYYIFSALRGIGSGAAQAVPTLVRVLEDENESINARVAAAFALGGVRAEGALPALKRVRDKYLKVHKQNAVIKQFLNSIHETIVAIERAQP